MAFDLTKAVRTPKAQRGPRGNARDVIVIAYWALDFSLSLHHRRLARALSTAGLSVGLGCQYLQKGIAPVALDEVGDLAAPVNGDYRWRVLCVTLGQDIIVHELHRAMPDADRTIVHTVFECDYVSPLVAAALNRFRGVWVGCGWHRDLLVKAGVPADRIALAGSPYLEGDPFLAAPVKPKWDTFELLNVGVLEPRKGQAVIVEAFLRTFAHGEPVRLVWKSQPWGIGKVKTAPGEIIGAALASPEAQANGWTPANVGDGIAVRSGILPRAEIDAMTLGCDVYVTAGSEGFDLPACDAKRAGKRLLYVAGGAAADFADQSDIAVEGERAPADARYGWQAGCGYTRATVPAMMVAMRRAFDEWRDGFVPSRERVTAEYSMAAVGTRLRAFLEAA